MTEQRGAEVMELPRPSSTGTPDTHLQATVQIAEYLAEPVKSFKTCPYEYWAKIQSIGKWPLLVNLARKFLSAPCGSVESKR
uniref:HAT C-terminal dimerisation domain-containing protein n=1 Tax=Meloidogyne enterolobii TaxID=390850 RepID=A0A6V7USX6_MELEN|nr:unnamed protein product [Meloidogyne enterolobii]